MLNFDSEALIVYETRYPQVEIRNCWFLDNFADKSGGTIHTGAHVMISIINSTFIFKPYVIRNNLAVVKGVFVAIEGSTHFKDVTVTLELWTGTISNLIYLSASKSSKITKQSVYLNFMFQCPSWPRTEVTSEYNDKRGLKLLTIDCKLCPFSMHAPKFYHKSMLYKKSVLEFRNNSVSNLAAETDDVCIKCPDMGARV